MENIFCSKNDDRFLQGGLPGYIVERPIHCELFHLTTSYNMLRWTPYHRHTEIAVWFSTISDYLYRQDSRSRLQNINYYMYDTNTTCFFDNFENIVTYNLKDTVFDFMSL